MRYFFSIIFCLLAVCAGSPAPAEELVMDGTVTDVSSGDTIVVTLSTGEKVKVRLYGINSPKKEKRDGKTGTLKRPGQPFGEEALLALKGKLDQRKVKIEKVGTACGPGKQVGIIRLDKRNIGLEMVREGFAWAYAVESNGSQMTEYRKAEEQARKERRGLWIQDKPQSPWEFIKLLKMKEGLLIGHMHPIYIIKDSCCLAATV